MNACPQPRFVSLCPADARYNGTVITEQHRLVSPELLAPAGGPAAGLAALQYGADAIYLGLPEFSARAEAENFTWESLGEIVAYAHQSPRPRRVYAAMNTLVLTRDIPAAVAALQRLAELRVDAVIVQDLGVARLARRHVPQLPLHASTQMAAHSVEGVRALARLGFSRVVLARELSLDEVAAIARDGGLEVEVFIHGTLCYAFSGLCLFSSHTTGRSGNRGRCSYGCRTAFGCGNKETMPFSMKDLALGDHLPELVRAGVTSLKIEGRMKSALYVSAVTDYYRRLLDGQLAPAQKNRLEEDLRTIFSRPWTPLHVEGSASAEDIIDTQTVGHRGARVGEVATIRAERDGDWLEFRSSRALELHDGLQVDLPGQPRPLGFAVDALRLPGKRECVFQLPAGPVAIRLPAEHPFIPVQAPVYCSSSQEVKRRYPVETIRPGTFRVRHPVRVVAELEAATLRVSGQALVPTLGTIIATVVLDGPFSPARQPEGTIAAAQKAFERLGDTDWHVEHIGLENPAGLFVPASLWNDARRRLAIALDGARENVRKQWLATVPEPAQLVAMQNEFWSVRLDAWPLTVQPADWEGADEIVLPISTPEMACPLPVRVALPLLIRVAQAADLRQRIVSQLAAGMRRWEISSLAGLELLHAAAREASVDWASLDPTSDWPLHTLNPQASLAGEELGFRRFVTSPEDEGENLRQLLEGSGHRALVLLLQFSPLFMAATGPAGMPDRVELRGRRGERYVEHTQDGVHIMTAMTPYALTQRLHTLRAAGARGFRVDLSNANVVGANPVEMWRIARGGEAVAGAHEGNFRRGLA